MSDKKGRVFSGARPTGRQHLGNYLGAIRNYVAMQDDYDCIYCIVDLHALTTMEDTSPLREWTYEMALDWLAAGIDPEERDTILFIQSHVPQVTQLHTLLSMVTPLGRLTRLPTFKDKVRQHPDNVNYGLVGYPVLMAADITLYKADRVPVGVDQAPHLEFTRDIVRRFNHRFGDVLVEPKAKYTDFPKVLGLDGEQKMSKSLDNYIEIAASPEEIERRVMTMVTDPQRRRLSDPGRPEVCNVFTLHGFFSPEDVERIELDCRSADVGCVQCKRLLAENLAAYFESFRQRRARFA
ncbi:MAG: tryptophan--tRNA ligase, partial [Chloroflexota bacterium]